MRELDRIIEKGEKVFWEGQPQFVPFVIGRSILCFLIGGFWLFSICYGLLREGRLNSLLFINPGFFVALFFLIVVPLYNWLVHKYTLYAITNKRVIIQTGVIGRDFQITDFDQITNAEVNVGLIDKIFGRDSGSVLISTAGTIAYGKHGPYQKPYNLSHVTNPYEVFKFFKKVSHDVKTDINYPNKYRPSTNPGYNTGYNPKDNS